jgi:hypothetical protein
MMEHIMSLLICQISSPGCTNLPPELADLVMQYFDGHDSPWETDEQEDEDEESEEKEDEEEEEKNEDEAEPLDQRELQPSDAPNLG